MKVLIVYDSLFGNTQKIAHAIAEAFGGHDVHVLRAKDVQDADLKDLGFLVVGSPTHGGRPSEETKKFLGRISSSVLYDIRVGTFDTGYPIEGKGWFTRLFLRLLGYAAKRIAKPLEAKGAKIVASETFFVLGKEGPLKEGELERAKEWANKLLVS